MGARNGSVPTAVPVQRLQVQRWRDGVLDSTLDSVADNDRGCDVSIAISQARFAALLQRRRNLTGRTGCGLCGAETIEAAMRESAPVAAGGVLSRATLQEILRALSAAQPLNAQTGSLHAAAWVEWGGTLVCIREDVGRHNALDKLIGALAASGADFGAHGARDPSRRKGRHDAGRLCAREPVRGVHPPGASAVNIEHLVSMANDIGNFFDAESGEAAAEGIAAHIARFWDPRMRAQIIAHGAGGGAGLSASASAAVRLLPPVKPC